MAFEITYVNPDKAGFLMIFNNSPEDYKKLRSQIVSFSLLRWGLLL